MDLSGRILAKRFRLVDKIGAGSFGVVYSGVDIPTGTDVAVKLELASTEYHLSGYEAKVLRQLRGGEGIPQVYWHGSDDDYNIMVMEQLGPSLECLLRHCNRLLSLKTTFMIALQLLTRLEYIHSQSFLHRDVKPGNFLVDRDTSTCIYAIDFGLAKKYREPTSRQHIPYREDKSLTGTARYVSLSTHLGVEQSRRDDVEALGYMLVYFLKGSLPWQSLGGTNKLEKYARIMQCKTNTNLDVLCSGLPNEFAGILQYARSLKFEDKPDYRYLMNILLNAATREGIHIDNMFDWHIPKATISSNIESMPLSGLKKKRVRRKKRVKSASPVKRTQTSSTRICDASSDLTDEIVLPQIKDRAVFNKLILAKGF